MKQVAFKKLEEITEEDVRMLDEKDAYISVITPRGAIRDVAMRYKYVEVGGKWELVPDHMEMWANGSWKPLSNELAKVFDPELAEKRMARKAKHNAEQKARREEIKAKRAAEPKMSFEEKFGGKHRDGYMGAIAWEGNNSGKYLGDAELASAIREDLKEYMGLPKGSVKVSKESYSMGRHIYVTLKLSRSHIGAGGAETCSKPKLGINHHHVDRYLEDGILDGEAVALLKRAVRIIESYNYDGSNAMVDYFDVNFYYDLAIEWVEAPEMAA